MFRSDASGGAQISCSALFLRVINKDHFAFFLMRNLSMGDRRRSGTAHHEAGGDEKLALGFCVGPVFGLLAESLERGARELDAGEADGGERG